MSASEGRVGAVLLGEEGLHAPDPLSDDAAEAFPTCHLVYDFQRGGAVSKEKLQAAGMPHVDQPQLEAFHGKGDRRSDRDGIQAVGVAVKIQFNHRVGIEDAEQRAAAGNGFILGPVHEHLSAAVGSGQRREVPNPVGAGDRAAHPAAVVAGIEQPAEHGLAEVGGLAVAPEAEVVGRQQVVVVHDGHDVGGADHGHFVLLGVELDNFPRMQLGDLLETILVSRTVGLDGDAGVPAGDQGLEPLVGKDRADAAAAGLLVAGALALGVVPAEIEAAEKGVFGAGAGRHHGDVARLALGEVAGQHLA